MRKLFKIGIPIIIFLVCLLLLLYPREREPLVEVGERPEFLVILTDNNENDFLDFKFISPGSGFYRIRPPLLLEEWEICGYQVENKQKTFAIQLPPKRMYLGENVRVSLGMDVLEAGKLYRVGLLHLLSEEIAYNATVKCG